MNVGVAAHITAAAPGGPRYDATLTSRQRAAADNGIWLCQTDAKLIDSDPSRYTVALLRQWKAAAVASTREMMKLGLGSLSEPVELTIPSLDTADSLLSFANTSVTHVGRANELAELVAFLEDDAPFSWWAWTGLAGMGKSRLAVELCRLASSSWHAGFLYESHQSRLGDLRTVRPTLVVVDYASPRSAWLGATLAQLSQQHLGAKVRVLVLEREASGSWWEAAQRQDRMVEAATVAATMYAEPRRLLELGRDDARALIRYTLTALGHGSATAAEVESVADRAESIDPHGRPLFVQVAAMDWLDEGEGIGGRDGALRRLRRRSAGQLAARLGDSTVRTLARNVQVLATALGGLSVAEFAALPLPADLPPGLLPSPFQTLGTVPLDEFVDGVRPDILGELFVLDHVQEHGSGRLASTTVLNLAWQAKPDAYEGFVERTAADHPDHPGLLDLLAASLSDETPASSAELAIAVMPLLKRSDHPVVQWAFERLESIKADINRENYDQLMVTATFRLANLVYQEKDVQRANGLFTTALNTCDPAWPLYGGILNNRGITYLGLGHPDAAAADYSTVIDAPTASNEARASALNNRADVRRDHGDIAASIADRTAVLGLPETTYNRRYIALARRAEALHHLGDDEGAYTDLETIITTPDISIEQKMAARLQRAQLFIAHGRRAAAQPDLDEIIGSYRNFASVLTQASAL